MKKKDIYTVRTTIPEAILITAVTVISFLGLVFLTLLPYTGSFMYDAMNGKDADKKSFDKSGEDHIISSDVTIEIEGDSMMNTYMDGDLVKATRNVSVIDAGDIVVFNHEVNGKKETLIKRVIATEGQTIDIDFSEWTVTVDGDSIAVDDDGEPCVEPYVNHIVGVPMAGDPEKMDDPAVKYPYTVPKDCLFVMGDNRNDSADSRSFGAISVDEVFAKTVE